MNDFIIDLIQIGLTESEAKVYFFLLKKQSFTATEISKLAHVSRSKVYEVLAKLVKKGFCTETLGRVRKYSAVNPEVGFTNLFKEFEEKKKIVTNLSKTLSPLYHSEKETTDPLDYIQVLREKSRIAEKYTSLEKIVKEELLSFTKAPYSIKLEDNEEGLNLFNRGVRVKTIYEVDEAKKPDFLKWVEMFANAGEEVRIAHRLPIKLAIFDEKIVLWALRDRITSKPSLTTMVIEHPDIAETFKITFNCIWQKSMTFEEFKNKEKGL